MSRQRREYIAKHDLPPGVTRQMVDTLSKIFLKRGGSPQPDDVPPSVPVWGVFFWTGLDWSNLVTQSQLGFSVLRNPEGDMDYYIVRYRKRLTNGTSTSSAAGSLTDSGATWTVDVYIGSTVTDADGREFVITDNDATTLTLDTTATPTVGTYYIKTKYSQMVVDHPNNGAEVDIAIRGLECSETYEFSVAAVDNWGNRSAFNQTEVRQTFANPGIVGGSITGTMIAASTIVAGHIDVATLSAISADMGTLTAGKIDVGSIEINATNEQILFGAATAPLTGVGIFQGKDGSDYEFRVGDPGGAYAHWDGSDLTVTGGIITSPGSGTDLSLLGWTHTLTFTATSNTQVDWGTGGIYLANGVSYTSIAAGDTGTMSALTYIYFDLSSPTALQTTTTASTAVGANKILVCVAENVASGKLARFQVFGGDNQGVPLITANNIAANTITANEIFANTITASQITTDWLTGIKAKFGTPSSEEVSLDSNGIAVSVGTSFANLQSYQLVSGSTVIGSLGALQSVGGNNELRLQVPEVTGASSTLRIYSNVPSGENARIILQATDTVDTTTITLTADSGSGSYVDMPDTLIVGSLRVGTQAAPPTDSLIYAADDSLSTTTTYYGLRSSITKTAGATDYQDNLYGVFAGVGLSHSATDVGNIYGVRGYTYILNGDVGSVPYPRSVHGISGFNDLHGGTIEGDAVAVYGVIDQEAGSTVAGDVHGVYVDVEAEGTVSGTVYGIFISTGINNDYGIYQDDSLVPNYFGGDVRILSGLYVGANSDPPTDCIIADDYIIGTGGLNAGGSTDPAGGLISAGHATIGEDAAPSSTYYLWVRDTTMDVSAPTYGLYVNITKTAGASDYDDTYRGINNLIELNQSGGEVGYLMGVGTQVLLTLGDVGATGNARDLRGVSNTVDLDAGKVWGPVYTTFVNFDQEATNEVTSSVFGLWIRMTADGTVGGNVYGVYIDAASTNMDYAFYSAEDAPIYTVGDIRASGGLYVGANTAPDDDDIHYDGNLKSVKSATTYDVYAYYQLATPITHSSFDGDSFSTVGTSTEITRTSWDTSLPAGVKAINVRCTVIDSDSSNTAAFFAIGPTATYYYQMVADCGHLNDTEKTLTAPVNVDGNGSIWYQCVASGGSTLDVWMEVWGYWI